MGLYSVRGNYVTQKTTTSTDDRTDFESLVLEQGSKLTPWLNHHLFDRCDVLYRFGKGVSMGIKKLVTLTVEVEIEIELPEDLANPTAKDIEDINACGFDVENSDDVYREAARSILMGFADYNQDVFGVIYSSWQKDSIENQENKSFYYLHDLYVEDFEAVEVKEPQQ